MAFPLPEKSLYVVSYPRSGNTWLINCLVSLLGAVRGEAYTPFELYTELHGDVGAGFHFWCEPRKDLHQPICIKSHDDLATFRTRHPPAPVVYIARDARDSLLSYYFFQQAYAAGEELGSKDIKGTQILTSRGKSKPTFDSADFSQFLIDHAPEWKVHVASARRDEALCYLTYEELTVSFEATLSRVIGSIGAEPCQSIDDVATIYRSGFNQVFRGDNRDFFRKGQIGDWANWFCPEHAELVDRLVGVDLRTWGFESDDQWVRQFGKRWAPLS